MKGYCRFAPSPTTVPDADGRHHGLHLGGARTALFSYLWARSVGCGFLIRSEDSDRVRSSKESEDSIIESLKWLGIESDIPIVRQSERGEIYQKYLDILLEKGAAYKCYCTPEVLDSKREAQKAAGQKAIYDRACCGLPDQPGKPYVVRLKVPDHGHTKINDKVLGRIQVNNRELSDPILRRSDGSFCFLFVNILDDCLQEVTHVLRGQDGISHCHSQVLLCEALGFEPPEYAHVPFVLGPDLQKLSKRNGAKSVLDLRAEGYLPEAVVNAIARIGCSYGARELLSFEELTRYFDVRHLNKSAGVFDQDKLVNINKHWIKNGDPERIADLVNPFLIGELLFESKSNSASLVEAVKTLQTRSATLKDMASKAKFYFVGPWTWSVEPTAEDKERLKVLVEKLKLCDYSPADIQRAVEESCSICNCTIKEVGPAVRMALSGSTAAPGVYEILQVLGKTESIKRLEKYLML